MWRANNLQPKVLLFLSDLLLHNLLNEPYIQTIENSSKVWVKRLSEMGKKWRSPGQTERVNFCREYKIVNKQTLDGVRPQRNAHKFPVVKVHIGMMAF